MIEKIFWPVALIICWNDVQEDEVLAGRAQPAETHAYRGEHASRERRYCNIYAWTLILLG